MLRLFCWCFLNETHREYYYYCCIKLFFEYPGLIQMGTQRLCLIIQKRNFGLLLTSHCMLLWSFRRFITNNIRKKDYATGKRDGLNLRLNFIVVIIIFVFYIPPDMEEMPTFLLLLFVSVRFIRLQRTNRPRLSMSVQI